MKIEKNSEGNGFVLTNNAGDSLNVSFMEFWDVVRAGTELDTKNEVIEYLSQCSDISGHDLDRIRAFPKLVDKITEQVIEDRIKDESGDQIYYAAEKCIKEHLSLLGSLNMIKWFELSDDKCISVWYSPDKYDGDQFQMHLEERCEDGSMGNDCEIISSESYATANISFEALCETLSEICDDADIFADDESAKSNLVSKIAKNIFSEFGMVDLNKEVKSGPIKENFKEDLPEYCYGTVPSTGELVIISRGHPGYTPASSSTTDREENERLAEKFNANMGVSKAQAAAMFVGSLFGWHVPGANPVNYDENGQFLHSEERASCDTQSSSEQAKVSLDEQITIANNQKDEICFAGYPSLEKIKTDYKELMEQIKNVRTIEDARKYCAKYPMTLEINGGSIDEFVQDGGTDKDIEWIRYESYGCLSYVYDRFDGKPMFDVSVDDGFYEFIHDIQIDDLTKENYTKWVNVDKNSSFVAKEDEREM